jgi:acyl-homoserine lactone acylase PvdQ
MDINRRVGLGRVSEVSGPMGLPFDRFARYHGWPRAAQAQMAGSSPLTRDVMDAFARGSTLLSSRTCCRQRLPCWLTALSRGAE